MREFIERQHGALPNDAKSMEDVKRAKKEAEQQFKNKGAVGARVAEVQAKIAALLKGLPDHAWEHWTDEGAKIPYLLGRAMQETQQLLAIYRREVSGAELGSEEVEVR
jgi:hypothetical protein